MKSKYIFFGLLAILLITALPVRSQDSSDAKFREGVTLYSDGKYQESLDKWLELYNSGYRSAALEYDLGNAYFKLNNVPGAILYYERALLLKPADEDINYNLQIARSMVVDKFTEIPEIFFVSWFNFLSLSLSTNLWAKISLTTFILFLLFFSVYIYTSRYREKVIGFWISMLMIVICISAFSFSSRNKKLVYNNPHAIIFSPLVSSKSSPDISGKDLFVLHEGTKVIIEDKVGDWYEIRVSDGNKGWVPSNCLNKL
jgi:tetratricopeptide (TPR) repeat protein